MNTKKIALKRGAPDLNQLHIELRAIVKVPFEPTRYVYDPDSDGRVLGTLIGKTVEDIVDAANEERLIQATGESGLDEHLGIWDRYIAETGEDLQGAVNTEYEVLRWEFVLCDEDGTVWSELVDITDDAEAAVEFRNALLP